MISLKGKRVLVTGGAGFVGGHLVEVLLKEKAKVTVIDIHYDKKSYFMTNGFDKKTRAIVLDMCDFRKLENLTKKYKIDFIFHLAAQVLVEDAYQDPKYTLENNIVSTINILEAVRQNLKIKGIVVASSDKAYGKLSKSKYVETDPLSGDHPYDTSKSVTDLISTTYYKTYKTPVVVTRFGNIYGEGDLNMSRIIPGIMEAIIKNKTLKIRSNGKYIRDYLYVKDVASGYILLAKNINKVKGEAFNFGSDDTMTVIELIKLVEKTLGKKINYKILNTARNEIPYQSLDYRKIKKTLNWTPKFTIVKTSEGILSWYKKIL